MGNALAYFLMMQLVLLVLLAAGAVYLLYCLGRIAGAVDRVANAVEVLVAQQNDGARSTMPPSPTPVANAPLAAETVATNAQTFVPTSSIAALTASAEIGRPV